MPRAAGLPVIGSLPQIVVRPLQFLEESSLRQGGIFELDLGLTRAVMVADVELAEHVLLKHASNYGKGGDIWEAIRQVIGRGLGTSEGELWRRQRKLISPHFQPRVVEKYRETIAETIDGVLGELDSRDSVNVARWCDRLTATISVRLLFGSSLDASRVDELRSAMADYSDLVLQGLVTRKLPRWLPLTGRARLERVRQLFHQRVRDLIAERRRNPGERSDLLGHLIDATDELGAMSVSQLLDEATTFYVAGYETTGTALAWTLWLLAGHPKIRDELQAELDRGHDQTPLLHACIQEGLRLYPPALFLVRHTVSGDVLGHHFIPKGTTVLVSPWLIHRNPELWPRPTEFDPGRFLDPERAAARPRLAWIPFGAGQRICVG
ncbi:MAG: cytochrome P450, partial [Myxococcales bacterium]|nr:cytochrome P450 [Myxococcales bacterium]